MSNVGVTEKLNVAIIQLQMTEKIEQFVVVSPQSIVGYEPCHDNDEVKLVPLVPKVTISAKNSQGHHLDDHFHSEESKDTVVQHLVRQTNTQLELMFDPDNNNNNRKSTSCQKEEVTFLTLMSSCINTVTYWKSVEVSEWEFLSPLVGFIPVGNSSGLAWLWLCLN